jgi:hypothetical protein
MAARFDVLGGRQQSVGIINRPARVPILSRSERLARLQRRRRLTRAQAALEGVFWMAGGLVAMAMVAAALYGLR